MYVSSCEDLAHAEEIGYVLNHYLNVEGKLSILAYQCLLRFILKVKLCLEWLRSLISLRIGVFFTFFKTIRFNQRWL